MDIDMSRIRIMQRAFHPVGQGAFYSEHFCDESNKRLVNVVYDCGTSTGKRYIEEEIEEGFKEGEIIDAVFISHLHDDHINGIPYLIRRCNVKKIFFPLLETPGKKFLVKLKAIVERAGEFSVEFIDSPQKAIAAIESESKYSHNIELIGVRANKDNELLKRDFDTVDEFDKGIDGVCHHTLSSGMNIAKKIHPELGPLIGPGKPYWIYIPYNFEFSSRIDELLKGLERNALSRDQLIELGKDPEKYKIQIELITSIYKGLSKDFNSHSMTVFSGGENLNIHRIGVETGDNNCMRVFYEKEEKEEKEKESNQKDSITDQVPSACLYTGDYKLDDSNVVKELKKVYSYYWKDLLLMQVPHHGSRKNYCGKLVVPGVIYVVSAGFKNRYNHPSDYVINDISANRGHPVVITEHKNSRISVDISFD